MLAVLAGGLLTTSCFESNARAVALTPSQRTRLEQFVASTKFAPDAYYVGFMSDDVVAAPDAVLNGIARRVLKRGSFTKQAVLDDADDSLRAFDTADTEDRERAYAGVERILDILGIKSSESRLNKAAYGFDPSRRPKR